MIKEKIALWIASFILAGIFTILLGLLLMIFCSCSKYNQIREVHTQGITTYDTSRTIVRDSITYPYWKEVCLKWQIDSNRTERTYFLIYFTAPGVSDSNPILLKKDTVRKGNK